MASRSRHPDWPKRIWRDCIANRSWGWAVQYTVEGTTVRKFFCDSTYGSSAKSRAAAEQFAHANVALHLELLALRRRLLVRKNSSSGIPGVARYEFPDRGPYWVAYWDDASGVKRQKKFTVAQYGERAAKRLAVACRAQVETRYRKRMRDIQKLIEQRDTSLMSARNGERIQLKAA